MGQTRNVLVYRLLCEGTVDEKIMSTLESKQAIFDAFADKSVAAAESQQIDDRTFGNIIKEEIDRINAKYGCAVGAVLDGYTRDTPKVIEQNFPVFCSGTWAQDSSVRTYVFKWRCPIEIGQVTIHNGDIVFGDIDGVLIIPKDIAPEVIEKALVKASTEKTMRKAIEDGMMVTDAFAKFGVL